MSGMWHPSEIRPLDSPEVRAAREFMERHRRVAEPAVRDRQATEADMAMNYARMNGYTGLNNYNAAFSWDEDRSWTRIQRESLGNYDPRLRRICTELPADQTTQWQYGIPWTVSQSQTRGVPSYVTGHFA